MKIHPLPPSDVATLSVRRQITGQQAERIACECLEGYGYSVVDLNSLAGNCPFADLLAHRGRSRVLIQVRGTTIESTAWTCKPSAASALDIVAKALGCSGFFAFVWFNREGGSTERDYAVRFARAADVYETALRAEQSYSGTNRYHIMWSDLDPGIVHRLPGGAPGMLGWR